MDTRRIHRISRIALAILSLYFVVAGIAAVIGGGDSAVIGVIQVVIGLIGLVITSRDLPARR